MRDHLSIGTISLVEHSQTKMLQAITFLAEPFVQYHLTIWFMDHIPVKTLPWQLEMEFCFYVSKVSYWWIKAFGYECIQNYWTTERTDGTELLGLGWMLLCYYEWGWNSAHPLHLLHTAMAITQYCHKSVNKSSVLQKLLYERPCVYIIFYVMKEYTWSCVCLDSCGPGQICALKMDYAFV